MDSINFAYRRKDDPVDGLALVKSASLRVSANSSKYLDMTLMDASGEINAKAWNWENGIVPENGSVIRLRGVVGEFAGKLQLRVDRLRLAQPEEIDYSQLVPCAPEDPEEMYLELYEAAEGLKNPDLRALSLRLLEDNHEKLLIWPAAVSYHHAHRAGLLQHTVTMLRAAKAILPVYPALNADLVLCGVIAHDLCKIREINAGEIGIATEYTSEGMLLGHLVLGVSNIARLARELSIDEETSLLVQHMVLSHHDTPEYGSPRPPMFPEAELLHQLDVLDARLMEMGTALGMTPEGQFSERVRSLENRRLYKAKASGFESAEQE